MNYPIKLLYLPNEVNVGDQVGPRDAFENLVLKGKLLRYEAFSFLFEAKKRGVSGMLSCLKDQVNEIQPDLLFWQHVGDFSINEKEIASIRAMAPKMRLIYHEGDVFGRWIKKIPKATRTLMAAADFVALVGRGSLADLVKSFGVHRVIYSPHSVDTLRFGTHWEPTLEREFDVIMIGNRIKSRLPWMRMPGASKRVRMVKVLGQSFGSRFAVFGHGWNEFVGNFGPIPFSEQEANQRRAWVTVSWDHFDTIDAYFSDRVPISLMSGVPHITNYQPGYEDIFGLSPPIFFVKSVDDLLTKVKEILAMGPTIINEIGRKAQDYCRKRFTARIIYERLLDDIIYLSN
jgi:hypothetical protein